MLELLDVFHASDALADGGEVRERAAEPALIDVILSARLGGFLDRFLRLLLAADEEHLAIARGDAAQEIGRFLKLLDGFAEVDDVDGVALLENEGLHFWVPALGLVTKVDTRLEKFRHQFSGHKMLAWFFGQKKNGRDL